MKKTFLVHVVGVMMLLSVVSCGGGGGNGKGSDLGPNLILSQSHENELSSSDAVQEERYIDSYKLTNVPAGSNLWVQLVANDFDGMVAVIPDDGTETLVGSIDAHSTGMTEEDTIFLESAGDYILIVSSYLERETGSYRLQLKVTTEPNEEVEADDSSSTEDDHETCYTKSCGMCEWFRYSSCSCVPKLASPHPSCN